MMVSNKVWRFEVLCKFDTRTNKDSAIMVPQSAGHPKATDSKLCLVEFAEAVYAVSYVQECCRSIDNNKCTHPHALGLRVN